MSRKDFQIIADAIKSIDDDTARNIAASALADALRGTNPRFDRQRFIRACNAEE